MREIAEAAIRITYQNHLRNLIKEIKKEILQPIPEPINSFLKKSKRSDAKIYLIIILKALHSLKLLEKSGKHEGNAYFFLNSVQCIIDVFHYLKTIDVTSDDVRIVCADSDDNKRKLRETIGAGYVIGSLPDFTKKLNFITSTAFEGSDLHDEYGITYIISDGRKAHTKYSAHMLADKEKLRGLIKSAGLIAISLLGAVVPRAQSLPASKTITHISKPMLLKYALLFLKAMIIPAQIQFSDKS